MAQVLTGPIDLIFTETKAVGFNVAAFSYQISVFDPAGQPLGSFGGSGGLFGLSFFGVISDNDQIGRIRIATDQSTLLAIDNVQFQTIPEPSTISLSVLAIILLALVRARRELAI